MRRYIDTFVSVLMLSLILMACGGTSTPSKGGNTSQTESVTLAKLYDYRVVAEYPHSSRSYTQGLEYVDGVM